MYRDSNKFMKHESSLLFLTLIMLQPTLKLPVSPAFVLPIQTGWFLMNGMFVQHYCCMPNKYFKLDKHRTP